jgi:hypothetical protein
MNVIRLSDPMHRPSDTQLPRPIPQTSFLGDSGLGLATTGHDQLCTEGGWKVREHLEHALGAATEFEIAWINDEWDTLAQTEPAPGLVARIDVRNGQRRYRWRNTL